MTVYICFFKVFALGFSHDLTVELHNTMYIHSGPHVMVKIVISIMVALQDQILALKGIYWNLNDGISVKMPFNVKIRIRC
jgi:hypothetical protein